MDGQNLMGMMAMPMNDEQCNSRIVVDWLLAAEVTNNRNAERFLYCR